MFIEELWDENRKIVEDAIKGIFKITTGRGDRLWFLAKEGDTLRFSVYGTSSYEMLVEDFGIKLSFFGGKFGQSPIDDQWRAFMTKEFGDRYVQAYESARIAQLKKYVSDFEIETNENVDKMQKVIEQNNVNNV